MKFMFVAVLIAALVGATLAGDSWAWGSAAEDLEAKQEIRESKLERRSADADKTKEEDVQGRNFGGIDAIYSNDTSIEEVIEEILRGRREGRTLGEYDQVYADANIQNALNSGDDSQARNLIKDKLCSLGLMSCDYGEEKRPFYSQIYGQGPPPNRVNGPPYGPPRPMPMPITSNFGGPPPPPNRYGAQPPRKVGYGFDGPPQQSPVYGGSPSVQGLGPVFSGPPASASGADIIYTKPPPGAVIYGSGKPQGFDHEGGDAPYNFEHIVKDKIQVSENQQSPSFYAPNPDISKTGNVAHLDSLQQHVHHHFHHVDGAGAAGVPVGSSNSITADFASLAQSTGGFAPSVGTPSVGALTSGNNYDYKRESASYQSGFNSATGSLNSNLYAKPNSGLNTGIINSQNQFGSTGFGAPDFGSQQQQGGSSGFGSSGAGSSFHSSNPDYFKKELNYNGNGNQFNNFGSQNKYQSQNQGVYNKYDTSRNQHVDCTCVPVHQCPASDRIGRKEDLLLPIDPRNLGGKDIEALPELEGNATLSSNTSTEAPKEESKKTKRDVSDVAADKQSNGDEDQPGDVEGVSFMILNPLILFKITKSSELLLNSSQKSTKAATSLNAGRLVYV